MSIHFDHGYALLIGVDENAVPQFALPDVSKDITALYAVLTHPERCAYHPEKVKRITGSAATRDGILEGLAWLHENLQADDSGNATAIVFYSGHGLRAAEGDRPLFYLVPYNARRIGLTASALNAVEFAAAINELQPKRLFVALDCCHAAGLGVKEASPVGSGYAAAALPVHLLGDAKGLIPSAGSAKGLESLQTGAGRAILSSSQGHQPSYIRKDRQMSIFTYHLIEALTGHAQPRPEDAQGATEVLVSDIMSHVYRRAPTSAQTDWNAEQTPDYQISGNFPVALLLGGKGLSKGQPAPDPLTPPAAAPVTQSATNTGSGAVAQGPGAVAAGERGVAAGGNISDSTITTGDNNRIERVNTGGGNYIRGNVNTGGADFVGRDKINRDQITIGNMTGNTGVAIGAGARSTTTVTTSGAAAASLDPLFAPLLAFAQVAPPEQRQTVLATVQAIKAEVERGAQADDRRLARALETLAALLPGAAGLILFAFDQPPLTIAIGPATGYVLEKLTE